MALLFRVFFSNVPRSVSLFFAIVSVLTTIRNEWFCWRSKKFQLQIEYLRLQQSVGITQNNESGNSKLNVRDGLCIYASVTRLTPELIGQAAKIWCAATRINWHHGHRVNDNFENELRSVSTTFVGVFPILKYKRRIEFQKFFFHHDWMLWLRRKMRFDCKQYRMHLWHYCHRTDSCVADAWCEQKRTNLSVSLNLRGAYEFFFVSSAVLSKRCIEYIALLSKGCHTICRFWKMFKWFLLRLDWKLTLINQLSGFR